MLGLGMRPDDIGVQNFLAIAPGMNEVEAEHFLQSTPCDPHEFILGLVARIRQRELRRLCVVVTVQAADVLPFAIKPRVPAIEQMHIDLGRLHTGNLRVAVMLWIPDPRYAAHATLAPSVRPRMASA